MTAPDIRTGSDPKGFYIRTFTGKQFYFHDIVSNNIDIRDIAHALAMNCRWTGHVKDFYSVAQHCVYVSKMVPVEHALAGLLHDASEAYMHDTPSPLKWHLKQMGFTAFAELEEAIDFRVFTAFGLTWPRDPSIKEADLRMLATEHRDLMVNGHDMEGTFMQQPYLFKIEPWGPVEAEREFLMRYDQLATVWQKRAAARQ